MTRKPLRFGCYYHIYNRGNNGETLFSQERNYRYFLKLYLKYVQPVAATYAYCLMPNHFHFAIRTFSVGEQQSMIEPATGNEKATRFTPQQPGRAFNNYFIAYTRAYNRAVDRSGTLFEPHYRCKIIGDKAYFANLITYIHNNPHTHGFVRDFRDWPWSSYGAMMSDKPTHIERDAILGWYQDRTQFHEAHFLQMLDHEDVW